MNEDADARLKYAIEYPAFVGSLEFDFMFELLGEQVTRRLKVEYQFTPDSEYYDLRKRALRVGWLVISLHFYVRPEPNTTDPDQREFDWIDFEPLIELIPDELRDKVSGAVEDACKQEDARRRMRFLESSGRT